MIDRLRKISPNILENEPMISHTSFKIGGNADFFVSVSSEKELSELLVFAKENGLEVTVMGNGSNMLVGDKGIRGLVIQIGSEMTDIKTDGETVWAQAGVLMSKLASVLLRENLSGFETLSGIPGTLGGGIFMNAGAYGGEIKDIVSKVTYIDEKGQLHTVLGAECDFGYRHSIFCDGGKYIVSAELSMKKGNYEEIKALMADYNKRRSDKQPLAMPSAGSTFKRPDGYFAGKLIQDAGLMGYSIGGAAVSEKHAGFVVNKGGASAADVLELIKYIQKTVREKFGVELEPEVRLIGQQ
jgi:UDP-N-acetylmuramate dehydrogenase